MLRFLKYRAFQYPAVIIIAVFCILFLYIVRWNGDSGNNYKSIITSDGVGYYHYFKSILFDKNLENQEENGIFLVKTEDRVVNKYYSGLAIVWSPFVLSTYLFDQNKTDAFAKPYQLAISLAALFYLILGLYFLSKFLTLLGVSKLSSSISVLLIFFATNLSYYSLIGSSMSHVYSFSLISILLYNLLKFKISNSSLNLILGAMIYGLVIIIRPINAISILLIFTFIHSFDELINFFKQIFVKRKSLIFAILLFLFPPFIQMILWRIQTGNFIVWSYSDEGFYFLKPKMFDFLLSFRKGLFIYTPIVLVALFGLFFIRRNSRFQFYAIFLSFILIVYILSAWWSWYYGDSFGMRSMIDFYSLFAFLIAVFFDSIKSKIFKAFFLLSAFILLSLNIMQSYQYYYFIMSHFDMNVEKYKFIFGKYSSNYQNVLGGYSDCEPFHTKELKPILYSDKIFSLDIKKDDDSCLIAESAGYYNLTDLYWAQKTTGKTNFHIKINVSNFDLEYAATKDVLVYFELKDSANNTKHSTSFLLNEVPTTEFLQWRDHAYQITFRNEINPGDRILLFLYSPENKRFKIDDFSFQLFSI